MERKLRPIIAVNIYDGTIRQFSNESEAARALDTSVQAIQSSRMWHSTSGEWRFYDTTENLRKRIERIEQDIEYLEGLGL